MLDLCRRHLLTLQADIMHPLSTSDCLCFRKEGVWGCCMLRLARPAGAVQAWKEHVSPLWLAAPGCCCMPLGEHTAMVNWPLT